MCSLVRSTRWGCNEGIGLAPFLRTASTHSPVLTQYEQKRDIKSNFERKILRSHDKTRLLSLWLSSILLCFHDLGLQVQLPAWWSPNHMCRPRGSITNHESCRGKRKKNDSPISNSGRTSPRTGIKDPPKIQKISTSISTTITYCRRAWNRPTPTLQPYVQLCV